MTQKSSDNLWVLRFLWKNKLLIAGLVLAAGIVTYVSTLFMTPNYEAHAIVYPAGEQGMTDMKLKQGNTLLLLQLLESSYLKDSVIRKMNLASHYGIDTTISGNKAMLAETFQKNTNFERTLYKSVKITVQDENPEFAASMANGIVEVANAINQKIFRENTRESLRHLKQAYREQIDVVYQLSQDLVALQSAELNESYKRIEDEIEGLQEEIARQRKELQAIRARNKVHNLNQHIDELRSEYERVSGQKIFMESQLESLRKSGLQDSVQVIEARLSGLTSKSRLMNERIDSLLVDEGRYNYLTHQIALNRSLHDNLKIRLTKMVNDFEPEVSSVTMEMKMHELENQNQRLFELKNKYDDAQIRYNQPVPAAYTFSKAQPAYKVAYPKKLLFTAGAMVLMLVLSVSVLLVIHGLNKYDQS